MSISHLPTASGVILTGNPAMLQILSRLRAMARTEGAVLLIGETGVGKELLAEYVHQESPRAARPLVKVGLASLPRELLESELFGHEKGAYTHAIAQKKGLFELSSGGSIFLDDIDDFPIELQAKLLRALEAHEILRVGGTTPIRVDSRLICATKVDLKSLVERRAFRADLYYRINVMPVAIPPLRERRDDIPAIAEYLLRHFGPDRELSLSDRARDTLVRYGWPGNIRELRNVIQRICLFGAGAIEESELPAELLAGWEGAGAAAAWSRQCEVCREQQDLSFDEVVACVERHMLEDAVFKAGGNQSQAARDLRMSLSTLRDKLRKHNL
ncbi:MAG TPA: sigma 54-interacting transcriptional regulator [Bryobacteraceae bacterium]|nr:sigma 54-interacting transcriptional regulator [Bryobacteraceae bacterium]